jgi:hypothetical protein
MYPTAHTQPQAGSIMCIVENSTTRHCDQRCDPDHAPLLTHLLALLLQCLPSKSPRSQNQQVSMARNNIFWRCSVCSNIVCATGINQASLQIGSHCVTQVFVSVKYQSPGSTMQASALGIIALKSLHYLPVSSAINHAFFNSHYAACSRVLGTTLQVKRCATTGHMRTTLYSTRDFPSRMCATPGPVSSSRVATALPIPLVGAASAAL